MALADDDDLDQEEGEAGYQPSSATGLNKIVKILIYVALGVVGLIVMVVTAYYVAQFASAQQYKEVSSIAVVKPPPPLESFNFTDDFRVNTNDRGESHFVKLRLSLGFEMGRKALSTELATRMPQLRNIINLILAGKSRDELTTIQGQLELREEIKASINHVLSEGKVEEVYFSEFIVN